MPYRRAALPRRLYPAHIPAVLVPALLAGIGFSFFTARAPETPAQDELSIAAAGAAPPAQGVSVNLSTGSVIDQVKIITIVADGQARQAIATGATVGDVLAEHGVEPRPLDRVTPAPNVAVTSGTQIRLVRIKEVEVTDVRA